MKVEKLLNGFEGIKIGLYHPACLKDGVLKKGQAAKAKSNQPMAQLSRLLFQPAATTARRGHSTQLRGLRTKSK